MSSSGRDEIIFGFTESEVKFLIMSFKCIETHGDRRFLNCERLAELTGYSSSDAYELYTGQLLQKITALPAVNLTGGGHGREHADAATTTATEEDGKGGSGAVKDDEFEEKKTKANMYEGIGDGVDGAGGDPEEEKELEALGSAYAWEC